MVTGVTEEVRRNPHLVTGTTEEIRQYPHMMTATQEEIPYCSPTTSSGKQTGNQMGSFPKQSLSRSEGLFSLLW